MEVDCIFLCVDCEKEFEYHEHLIFCEECGEDVKKRCPSCDTICKLKAKFCSKCRHKFLVTEQPKQVAVASTYKCECGATNETSSTYCDECGEPNKAHPTHQQNKSEGEVQGMNEVNREDTTGAQNKDQSGASQEAVPVAENVESIIAQHVVHQADAPAGLNSNEPNSDLAQGQVHQQDIASSELSKASVDSQTQENATGYNESKVHDPVQSSTKEPIEGGQGQSHPSGQIGKDEAAQESNDSTTDIKACQGHSQQVNEMGKDEPKQEVRGSSDEPKSSQGHSVPPSELEKIENKQEGSVSARDPKASKGNSQRSNMVDESKESPAVMASAADPEASQGQIERENLQGGETSGLTDATRGNEDPTVDNTETPQKSDKAEKNVQNSREKDPTDTDRDVKKCDRDPQVFPEKDDQDINEQSEKDSISNQKTRKPPSSQGIAESDEHPKQTNKSSHPLEDKDEEMESGSKDTAKETVALQETGGRGNSPYDVDNSRQSGEDAGGAIEKGRTASVNDDVPNALNNKGGQGDGSSVDQNNTTLFPMERPNTRSKTAKSTKDKEGEKVFGDTAQPTTSANSNEKKANDLPEVQGATAYNKFKNQPEEYQAAQSKGNAQKKKETAGQRKYKDATIDISFHVVVSKDVKYKKEKHEIQIRSGALFGSWDNTKYVLKHVRDIKDMSYMTIEVQIPKYVLSDGATVEYKYYCHKPEKEEKSAPYEFLFRKQHSGTVENRSFYIPPSLLPEKDRWHVFDGVMHSKPNQNKIRQFWSYITGNDYEDIITEAKTAMWEMLPHLKQIEQTPAFSVLERIAQIHTGFRTQFLEPNSLNYNPKLFKEVITDYVIENLEVVSKQTGRNRVIWAFALLTVCRKHNVDYYVDAVRIPLFHALRLEPDADKNTVDMDRFNFHFTEDQRTSILRFLRDLLEDTAKKGEVTWINAIPWVHFINLTSKPFESYALEAKHFTEPWWGISGIVKAVDAYKHSIRFDSEHAMALVRKTTPVAHIDHMLQKTVVALLSFDHLKFVLPLQIVDSVVCMANIYYFLRTTKLLDFEIKTIPDLLKMVVQKIKIEQQTDRIDRENAQRWLNDNHVGCLIALDLLKQIQDLTKMSYGEKWRYCTLALTAISTTIEVFNKYSAAIAKLTSPEEKSENNASTKYTALWHDFTNVVQAWFSSNIPFAFMKYHYSYGVQSYFLSDGKEIEVLSQLLSMDETIQNQFSRDQWVEALISIFRTRIDKGTKKDRIVGFCMIEYERYHKSIETCYSEVAFQVVESLERGDMGDFNVIFGMVNSSSHNYKKFSEMISKLLVKDWPKKDEQLEVLSHILTWPTFNRYFSMFCATNDKSQLLSDRCQVLLAKGISYFSTSWDELVAGTISCEMLKVVLRHQERFCDVLELAKNGSKLDANPKDVLKARNSEMEKYKELKLSLSIFANYCSNLKQVDVSDLQLAVQADVDKLKLPAICDPIQFDITQPFAMPQITAFKVPFDVYAIIPALKRYMNSYLFIKHSTLFCERECQRVTTLSMDNVLKDVYHPAVQALGNIVKHLKSGDTTLQEIDGIFAKFESSGELIEELEVINGSREDWIDTRVRQIDQYYRLNTYKKGADIMDKVRQHFQLTGNFKTLEILANAGNDKNLPLKSISEDVVKAGEDLKDIGKQEAKCIETLHECQNLVTWLRENAKSIKEVKTLVDLAMMSAQGQGAMEVQKVSCLHAAATGYGPLIYDLPQHADFAVFLNQCKQVWRSLEKDPHLPKHLSDTNQHLKWLKEVKESHGSVEVNALTQASNINARGIYRVGAINEKHGHHVHKTLDTTVKLVLLENSEGKRDKKEYSFAQLCDLQSKLMLVAGKAEQGNEEVERFVQILDGVTRLANAFLKLSKAGCILFKQWNATFYCDSAKAKHTEIDFGNKNEQRVIIPGLKKNTREVSDEIKAVCEFMESCLDQWTNEINRKREEFYFLNFFTTEQLVILCTEIAQFCHDTQKHSPRIYSLLDRVKPHCTTKDLRKAVEEASNDLKPKEEAEMETEQSEDEEDKGEDIGELTAKFLAEVGSEYSLELAKRALVALGDPTDIDGAILWCMEHMEDDSSGENSPRQEARETLEEVADEVLPDENNFAGFKDIIQTETLDQLKAGLLKLTMENEQLGTLKNSLTELWDQYMKSSSTISVSDFLSVHHLGYILRCLHKADGGTPQVERELPSSCTPGKANLIVCPESEVFQVCLSIYMDGKGKQLPLPSDMEVLLCTTETRVEEVELFLRRAFGMHKEGKLYCLVNADRLEYEVGVQIEKFYEIHSKRCHDFQLVIVCAKEREDKSTIATAFERYRIKFPQRQDHKAIKEYITKNLIVDLQQTPNSLAVLDPEMCGVRVVKSHRAGVGKSLKASRLATTAKDQVHITYGKTEADKCIIRVSMHQRNLDVSDILKELLEHTQMPETRRPRLIHLDIAHEVQEGVDDLLFSLVILGSVSNQEGYVWRRSNLDHYVIEAMPIVLRDQHNHRPQADGEVKLAHQIFYFLPTLTCWSPTESRQILGVQDAPIMYRDYSKFDQLMDMQEFRNTGWQRVYQYLDQHGRNVELNVDPGTPTGTPENCLDVLLKHCGLRDPSWAELRHFVWFLNVQLLACDSSVFCDPFLAQDLPGFKKFVVKCMIQMSRDFATRSLNLTEETPQLEELEEEDDLERFQLKRRWESSPHPYVFFNADGNSMTFLGFNIGRNGEMIDLQTGRVLEQNMMAKPLKDALRRNMVPLNEDFDALQRIPKIDKIHRIMGIMETQARYPDESYVLTTDNVKKIMAIYMRFRCGIPVIIMGETGCGKTRLIKFMCDLQKPKDHPDIENMILMKVHGGTSAQDIDKKLKKAAKVAQKNQGVAPNMDTVLFFDEANTTEEIGLIKRVMVDNESIIQQHGLKIVAACNPYRKHSDDMIKRLEQAGLGYHIQAEETRDKLGTVPMRRLVYRVQALPQSMLPLVWDFGQLDIATEAAYIQEMVNKCIADDKLPALPNLQATISTILAKSQQFMRQQEDECSFVSLRDVERVLSVTCWFYEHRDKMFERMNGIFIEKARENVAMAGVNSEDDEEMEDEDDDYDAPQDVTRSLILALGVCYHACLNKRKEYRNCVAPLFQAPLDQLDESILEEEINCCQDVFLKELTLDDNIARNQALKENVFMMVVCIELRIPLFLVGKPGSSKSLAKTIVADAMQGEASKSDLFKGFKSVHMVSYQCSPLATPQGIVGTFKQCADLQDKKDLDKFVSVVVLDEVGLAEDSPRMPLKALHPLLEDGCEGDEEPKPHMKVAFIGISNWALDPAKMNRGILVQRGVPDIRELEESAKGICATDELVQNRIMPVVQPMATAYLKLYNSALEIREFFGLRDFYSIIKMVYGFAKRSGKPPTWFELKHSILRNFGGLDDVDPMEVFEKVFTNIDQKAPRVDTDPDCSPAGLIRACLFGEGLEDISSESRYLLILTENYAALKILQQQLLNVENAQYIFGSSFPKDQEYTQVCRNINRIKICMETGQTVVLMNLENLYESLYDALNQYYVYLGGQRFVDLGLGTHRVKCKVHQNFRLIVVAEKQVVYKKFPIPLINRLEKHTLTMETILTDVQLEMVRELEMWAQAFLPDGHQNGGEAELGDTFIGYEKDTAASVVLQACSDGGDIQENYISIVEKAKRTLLQCATPESILRLKESRLHGEEADINKIYYQEQQHENIEQFLRDFVLANKHDDVFVQVSTHSKLMSTAEVKLIGKDLKLKLNNIQLESLQAFDTEQQFCKQIKTFFKTPERQLLVLQCDSGDENSTLTASARYNIMEAYRNDCPRLLEEPGDVEDKNPKHVVFIIQLPRKKGGCFTGFEGGKWISYHVDDLQPDNKIIENIHQLRDQPVSAIFGKETDLDTFMSKRVSTLSLEDNTAYPTTHRPISDMEVDDMEPMRGIGGAEAKSLPSNLNIIEPPYGEPQNNIENQSMHVVEEQKTDTKINSEELIKICVHGAAAMLEDENKQMDRKTERIRILIKLLDGAEEQGESLMKATITRLCLLLKEKEKTVSGFIAVNDWLAKEAAHVDNIIKAGTFRRSVQEHLEQKVTPLLAGIIAYCDSNSNLDLLTHWEADNWVTKLWLAMIHNAAATNLKYSDLTSATRDHELERIQVRGHGPHGTHFQNHLPFCWVIKHKLDELVHHAKKDRQDEHPEKTVEKLFGECAVGKIVRSVISPEHRAEYLTCYRRDFVRMVYTCQSEDQNEEYKLIEDKLQRLVEMRIHELNTTETPYREPVEEDIYTESLLTETQLHVLYDNVVSRVQLFAHAVQLCPGVVSLISKSDNEMFGRTADFTLDVQALLIMLETLNCEKVAFKKEAERVEWLRQVEVYRPYIERMLEISQRLPVGMHSFDDVCQAAFKSCRYMWSRICALQLFLNHVCMTSQAQETKFTVDLCSQLWKLLRENTDFKEEKTFNNVEHFLKLCTGKAFKHYIGDGKKCPKCEELREALLTIPCKERHEVCLACAQEHIETLGLQECPKCRNDIPQNYKPKPSGGIPKEKLRGYKNYQQRCNAFFMEIVSRLCFAGDEPPSDKVVGKLLNYVTKETDSAERLLSKPMSLYKDANIDPTPAVRSFLLQLLLRSNVDDVREHLQEFFQRGKRVLGADSEHKLKLCLLFMHCIEDALFGQYQQAQSDTDAVRLATGLLRKTLDKLLVRGNAIDKLETIAKVRLGLSVTAHWLHKVYCTKDELSAHDIRRLADAAAAVCDQRQINWPRLYLVRLINKRYGENVLKQLSGVPHLGWILPPEAKPKPGQKLIPADRFLVYKEEYIAVKAMIKTALYSGDFKPVHENLAKIKSKKKREMILLLAMHREVSVSLIENGEKTLPANKQALLQEFIQAVDFLKRKDLAQLIITRNNAWLRGALDSGAHGMRAELFVHFLVLLSQVDQSNKWLSAFQQLAENPQAMQGTYLPTMPQDHWQEVFKATEEHRIRKGENFVMYQCPNGHPYGIGDCGQPNAKATCIGCGAKIGAAQYGQIEAGNTKANNRGDKTATGHILGKASTRSKTPIPERKLGPAATTIIRLLTHMSMYLGSCVSPDQAASLVNPVIDARQVGVFFLDHVACDLEVLRKALNRSPEDCCVFIHSALANVIHIDQERNLDASLRTQQSRSQWENHFSKAVLSPSLNTMVQILQSTQAIMLEDQKHDANPLLKILYESDPTMDDIPLDKIQESPFMWQFRTRVSIDNLAQVVTDGIGEQQKKKYQILVHFIQQGYLLRALRFLPDILHLQKLLIRRYNNSIDGAEATTMTIQSFLKELQRERGPSHRQYQRLIHSFQQAWTSVKEQLATFVCGPKPIAEEYQNLNVHNLEQTSLAMLLPSWRGQGVCAIALVNFLVSVQNDFLVAYRGFKDKGPEKAIPLSDVTSAQLIAYHPERDLLPLVTATRNYTVVQGKTTSEEIDFEALQRQIEERFIRGRCSLQPEVETITFREDFTNAKVFQILNERIPQVPLDGNIAHQIASDYRHLMDISLSLSLLDIAIGYLISVESDPKMLLHEFMAKKLTLKRMLFSNQAQRCCRLEHVQSLWFLLSHCKATQLHKHGHDAFDNIEPAYKEELTQEMKGNLHSVLHHTNVHNFMAELCEFIILKFTTRRTREEAEVDVNQVVFPLGFSLNEYIDEKEGIPINILEDESFPGDILFKHCTAVWKEAHEFIRQTNHR